MLLSADGMSGAQEASRSMWKDAFADAANLLQKRDPNPNMLPTLPATSASKWTGHGSKPVAPTVKGAVDLASYGADALDALKAREVQLVSANAAITAADDAWAKSRLDNKASADTAFLAKMQAEVSARAATKAEEDAKVSPNPNP